MYDTKHSTALFGNVPYMSVKCQIFRKCDAQIWVCTNILQNMGIQGVEKRDFSRFGGNYKALISYPIPQPNFQVILDISVAARSHLKFEFHSTKGSHQQTGDIVI